MGQLQHVPNDRRGVHPAAQHGDQVGHKHKSQPTMAQDLAHDFESIASLYCNSSSRAMLKLIRIY